MNSTGVENFDTVPVKQNTKPLEYIIMPLVFYVTQAYLNRSLLYYWLYRDSKTEFEIQI